MPRRRREGRGWAWIARRLDAAPAVAVRDQLHLATAITNRTLAELAQWAPG